MGEGNRPVKCMRSECDYYCTNTRCCEYILMERHIRPCPANACTVYKPAFTRKQLRLNGTLKRQQTNCQND